MTAFNTAVLMFIHSPGLTGVFDCMQPPFDRDFPSLAGRSNVGKSWHSGAALPEQQWTRLADAPDGSALSPRVSNPRAAEPPLAEPLKPFAPKHGSGPVDVPGASHARMSNAVQQVGSQQCTHQQCVPYGCVVIGAMMVMVQACSTLA